MTRVAFIDQVGQSPGGAQQTLATFLKHAPADIDPVAVLFEEGAFADYLRSLGIPVDVVELPADIKGSTRERPRAGGVLQIAPTALRIAGILRKRRAQLTYTNSMKAHFVGTLAARLASLPCVMHFHDIVEGLGLRGLRSMARWNSRECIACSRTVADAVGVGKTTVIYAPIELDAYRSLPDRRAARAKLGLADDLPHVAIVGRINRWKGHDRFIRIAARVNAVAPTRFIIAGSPIFRDADFLPELERLVEDLELGSRVSFIPWLEDVRTVYAAIDVNTNCSDREPFGRTVIEAAAAGVPTVCFDDSGASETIVDGVTGHVVPAGDEERFASALIDCLRDASRLSAAGRAAREASGRFDATRIAGEMAEVMRRAAS